MTEVTAKDVYDYINGPREFVALPADSHHSRDTAEGSGWMFTIRRHLKEFDPQSLSLGDVESLIAGISGESLKDAACAVLTKRALQHLQETLDDESRSNLDSLILDYQPLERKV
ncbi:MAG: hypothetical protein ACYTDT_10175 [Planctomycetota bacterium]|jgi:hypothetical protein